MHFAPNAPQHCEYFRARYLQFVGPPKKKDPSTKLIWPIAFAGELGHVVSRVLPHIFFWGHVKGYLGQGFPAEVGTGVCLIFFSMCPGLSGEPGESGFGREPASVTPSRCTYERELFPNSYEQILNPRPRNNFLNPESYSEVGATNPEIICETNFVFANPTYWKKTLVNHVN